MAKIKTPLLGGKYIRRKDGSLERVGGTDNDPVPAPPEPTEPVVAAETSVAATDGVGTSTKKGK